MDIINEELTKYKKPGFISFAQKMSVIKQSEPINFGIRSNTLNWKQYNTVLFKEGDAINEANTAMNLEGHK